jgi:leucine-rich repeat protein SHOC2
LTSLDLSSNPLLSSLPEEIGNLSNLKQLRISGCSLKTLPVSVLLLEQLNSLEVNNNILTGFFSEYNINKTHVKLDNLSFLSLNGNKIDHIPKAFKYLTNLKQLHLHQNKISDIEELCRS